MLMQKVKDGIHSIRVNDWKKGTQKWCSGERALLEIETQRGPF